MPGKKTEGKGPVSPKRLISFKIIFAFSNVKFII